MKSELLTVPKVGVREYTHIINVGSTTSNLNITWIGYNGATSGFPLTGSIIPNTFEGFTISGLLQVPGIDSSGRALINFGLVSYDNVNRSLYIARKDNQFLANITLQNYYLLSYVSGELFSTSDVGKDVLIWLSTTPPLMHKSCNSISFRISA